jgi:protein TonB
MLAAFLLAVQAATPPQYPAPPPAAPAPTPPTDWPPAGLFSDDDYPAAALRAGDEGLVRYRIEIGASGRVSNCAVTGSSGSAALDQATCRIVRTRTRFTPARDGAGNAVPDAREGEISWRLPRRD